MVSEHQNYDALIVGGGVNGVSIARALAAAGKSVLLVEQGDLAQATSSASSKLLHGGLRYLEHYEFKLVREALLEREIILSTAPHISQPLEFRLPHNNLLRPWFIIRIGLWLYDFFARSGSLPNSRAMEYDDGVLNDKCVSGFSYWDGWIDDSRLVSLNAIDAHALGAQVNTRTRFKGAKVEGGVWHSVLIDGLQNKPYTVTSSLLINAAGPWVNELLQNITGNTERTGVRLVRGSHLIVPRIYDGVQAYILQQPDGRIVFAIPYEFDFTLIGTTDVLVEKPEHCTVSDEERQYLIDAANRYFRKQISADKIIHEYAGIRPLYDDGNDTPSAVTRDYKIDVDTSLGATLLSVFGGKITTARHLAEVVLNDLGIEASDTASRPFPGGDFPSYRAFLTQVRRRWPFLNPNTSNRLARAYGTYIADILKEAKSIHDLGINFGSDLTEAEVDYLVQNEWAQTSEDILWRRTKLGLRFSTEQVRRLDMFLRKEAA